MFNVYCIECFTPNHLYVGQTGHLFVRILHHMEGKGFGHPFTKEHGVKSWKVIACIDTRKEAIEAEIQEYQRLKALGYIVGGFISYEAHLQRKEDKIIQDATKEQKYLLNKSYLDKVMSDTSFKTIRARSRALAPLINKSPEAAMSMIRRAYKANKGFDIHTPS